MTRSVTQSTRDLVLDGLLRSAPLAVFAFQADGTCVFSEGSALHQLGFRPQELVGTDLWEMYRAEPHILDRMRRALDGETVQATDTIGERTYDTWFLPLTDSTADEPMAVGISVDVTDRVLAQAAGHLYRAFAEAAPQFIALARVDGPVLYVNPGGRQLAGIPDDVDLRTTTIQDFLTPAGLTASLEVEQPAVIRDGHWTGETTLRHWPTGEGIPVQVSSFLVADLDTGEPLALATVQSDIREVVAGRLAVQRQIAHQRGLLHHLHEAQEAERQRIAGDIHDDTVQVMAAVTLRLQSLRRALEPVLPPERLAELETLDRSVRDATTRLRRLLVELDEPFVDSDDLASALRQVADASAAAGGPTASAEVEIDGQPSPIVARAVLRIAHEALTNVRKHARADTVTLRLLQQPGEYVLQVVDDGTGLAPGADSRGPQHRGVRGMRERAESVGGSLVVSSRPGGGVVAEARLPTLLGYPGAEVSLPDSRTFLHQVMESISDAYCALDADWRYVYMNRAWYALFRRDRSEPVVGKVAWDEFDVGPEFAAAWHRARDEQVEVEVTGHYEAWDIWIHNRILPTAGGLSIYARDVTDEVRAAREAERNARMVRCGLQLARAMATGGSDDATVLRDAAAALVDGWPLLGVRLSWPGGSVEAGTTAGQVRPVPLEVSGREVGTVELVGEDEPVDADLLQLLALRLSAVVPVR